MLKDISYLPNEKNIIEVERAITELRRGGMVLLSGNGETSLVLAMETLTPHELERFAGLVTTYSLVLSANRAKHIFKEQQYEQHITLPAEGKSLEELQQISGLNALDDKAYTFASHEVQPAGQLAGAAITLTKAAELLPSALIAPSSSKEALINWARRNDIICLEADALAAYKEVIATSLTLACDAPLCLEHAEHSHITAFRPVSGGKEHYAIVIGNPFKETGPVVRIHSSCYTGDLLGSLRCDCGDQLRGAIEFMGASEEGGIIIYLMQEGRGIGLTNKLRTYALQETGIDTVDANEILGFDDDERLFQPAAEILKQLGYNQVRLLTNNFRKAKGLETYGIKVIECVPHVMQPHEHNSAYLKTKANRLGHNLPK
jgi:GTP cyclohydrolase II